MSSVLQVAGVTAVRSTSVRFPVRCPGNINGITRVAEFTGRESEHLMRLVTENVRR